MINMAQKANLNNAKKMVNKDKQASWWESQIKVVKKIIKWQIAWCWTGKLLAFSPIMLLWWILIASFLYPGIDTSYVRTDWPYMLISAVCLTAMMLGIVLYNEHKLKRLYYQICNWTWACPESRQSCPRSPSARRGRGDSGRSAPFCRLPKG